MYVCMCVCVQICLYVCMYVRMYVYMHSCIHMHREQEREVAKTSVPFKTIPRRNGDWHTNTLNSRNCQRIQIRTHYCFQFRLIKDSNTNRRMILLFRWRFILVCVARSKAGSSVTAPILCYRLNKRKQPISYSCDRMKHRTRQMRRDKPETQEYM